MQEAEAPKFFIKTFGCQMNMEDSAELARLLLGMGMREAGSFDAADFVHINTCSIREKAEDKFFSYLGKLRQLKARRGRPVIGVGGCTPELIDIAADHPEVDYVAGSKHPSEYMEKIRAVLLSEFPELEAAVGIDAGSSISSFHTVIRGCSNYCTYCVVPYARGPEESLLPPDIADAVRIKVDAGAREIIFLGQNILAYGYDLQPRLNLLDVFSAVHDIEGLKRIRFVTSHPKWVSEEFVSGLRDFPKVCEHFHVPFQSGDDVVLKRMNRGYTSGEYIDKIKMIREYFPGAGITADVIVGFAGETEEQFSNTMKLAGEIRADQLYMFKYSVRSGTRAADWGDGVEVQEKKDRLRRLADLQGEISRSINEALIGSEQEVMITDPCGDNRYKGRTRTNKITDFTAEAEHAAGDVAGVLVTGATPHALQGKSV
ncbi:MAG TPA: tRNA (N6-isopentenyl adenosine(37)-C2)-methylthiotransferase MiaB [bacterium]|nr:tRNA (N6-isopentenyl adenosine(37)-C2)-methylthiotransferase MiaB [bacterium]